ncbi:hypothetical protein PM082_020188 [Marasmius tenuissimus]|nr:hypothetical protein PM082_020188 [Marasmius tenuissimus]
MDFLNNRELRRYPDALNIVKKLRKVAKECKRAWVPPPPKKSQASPAEAKEDGLNLTSPSSAASFPLPTPGATEPPGREHPLGERFAEAALALKKTREQKERDEDSDADLDFVPDHIAATAAGLHIQLGPTGIPLCPQVTANRCHPRSTSSIPTIRCHPSHRTMILNFPSLLITFNNKFPCNGGSG